MSVEAETRFHPNVRKKSSALVRIMMCATKGDVCTCGVKHERERVKDFIIQETLEKTVTCM